MQSTLLKSATLVIPNEQTLVNVVRQRVRQLIRGHRFVRSPTGKGSRSA